MEGSIFPNGVLIDRTSLRRVETTKSEQILRTRVDITSRGVLSGGVVIANAIYTDRVDVPIFAGYTPRGDYIFSNRLNAAVTLADYTLGTVNVVCAVYTESSLHSQPHETDGLTYPTQYQAAYRIRVYTAANFANLSVLPASDANLQNDALDRCLILAKVTAEGSGNPIVTINLPTSFDNVLYTTPSALLTLTGVTILDIDPTTPSGLGTITFDDTAAPPYHFYWTSPGGIISAFEHVSADSIVTITDGSGKWIKLQILLSMLPSGLTVPYIETCIVSNLYYQEIPRLTAEDTLHRTFLGTGIVAPTNPHGLSINDLAGSTLTLLDEHQDVMHCNGIWRGSSTSIFYPSANIVSTGGDTLLVQPPPAGSLFYVNGLKLQTLAPTSILFDAAAFTSGSLGATTQPGAKLYDIYVDDNATLVPSLRAAFPSPRTCRGTWIADMSPNHPAGIYSLQVTVAASNLTFAWGLVSSGIYGGAYTVTSPHVSLIYGQMIRLYAEDGVNWIDVYVGDDSVAVGDRYIPQTPGVYADSVVVYPALDWASNENMKIHSVVYWYDSTVPRGSIGVPPYGGASRLFIDQRPWGNLCTEVMSDEAMDTLLYTPTSVFQKSGIIRDRYNAFAFNYATPAGLTSHLMGGQFYCRGKVVSYSGADVTFIANRTSLVWLDYLGVLHVDNFAVAPYSSSLTVALEWICGSYNDLDPLNYPSYVGASTKTPERGIPLFLVTSSAGALTRFQPIFRCVGKAVQAWSVGNMLTNSCAEFCDLSTAFSYAEFQAASSSKSNCIDIKIVDDVYIYSVVTQPAYVTVSGSSASSRVIDYSSVAVPTGIWVLSSGCKVRDLAVIGGISSFFRLSTNCHLDRIIGISISTGKLFAVTTVNDSASISNSKFYWDIGLFYIPGSPIACTNLKFRDNYVSHFATATAVDALANFRNMLGVKILNNVFDKINSATSVPVVQLQDSDNALVSGNTVKVGEGAGADSERGIYAVTCTGLRIVGNYVTVLAASATHFRGIGIQVRSCTATIVSENHVNGMGIGILAGAGLGSSETGYFETCSISNNVIGFCSYAGIAAKAELAGSLANTIFGLSIRDNTIVAIIATDASGVYWGTYAYGIRILATNVNYVHVTDFEVVGNFIDTITNTQTGTSDIAMGISLSFLGSVTVASLTDMIRVDRNDIVRVSSAAASGNILAGISFYSRFGNQGTNVFGVHTNLSFSDNSIYLASTVAKTDADVYGIVVVMRDASAANTNVNVYKTLVQRNNVSINVPFSVASLAGTGIEVGDPFGPWTYSDISGNNVYAPWYGIVAGVGLNSKVSENVVVAGSVGIRLAPGTKTIVSGNSVLVSSMNHNEFYSISLSSPTNGSFCILADTGADDAIISNNFLFLTGAAFTNNLLLESANLCVANSASSTDEVRNVSILSNVTSQSYATTTGVPYHIYCRLFSDSWILGENIVRNNVGFTLPAHGHGIYMDYPSQVADMLGVLRGNVVYGSNLSASGLYEAYVGDYGFNTDGNPYLTLLNNTILCDHAAGATISVNFHFDGVNFSSNGCNMCASWDGGSLYAPTIF